MTSSLRTSEGRDKIIPLAPRSVADFYSEFMAALTGLGIEVKIWHMPVEVPDPIAFDHETQHASYDREYATRFWRILLLWTTFPGISFTIRWQEQPGAFLLGKFRSGGHALFRTACAS